MRSREIWWATLDPTVGHEQRGDRPVLVLSATRVVRSVRIGVVVPLTMGPERRAERPLAWTHVAIADHGWALAAQVRAVSVQRFRRLKGRATAEEHRAVAEAVVALWGLDVELTPMPGLTP